MPTFHADPALRADVLAQMQAHASRGDIKACVVVNSRTIHLYAIGWEYTIGQACADLLGLPAPLVNLGMYLFDSLPESLAERREFVDLRREMLAAFPLGADLRDTAGNFCYQLLKKERYGIPRQIHSAACAALHREVLGALYADPQGAFLDEDLRQRVRQEIEQEIFRSRELWQAERRRDHAGIETRRVLDTLEAVVRLPIDDGAAAAAAEASVYGSYGMNVTASFAQDDLLRGLFIRVLAQRQK